MDTLKVKSAKIKDSNDITRVATISRATSLSAS